MVHLRENAINYCNDRVSGMLCTQRLVIFTACACRRRCGELVYCTIRLKMHINIDDPLILARSTNAFRVSRNSSMADYVSSLGFAPSSSINY